MEKQVLTNQRFGTRQITTIGMLSAISIVLGLTGYGFIPLPPPLLKATIMHLPVIIGAIVEGPVVGALIGLIFGIFSIIQNIMAPNILSFLFINPMVSVLPRVLIGITSYYCFKAVSVKNNSIKIGVGAAVGSLTNTIGVLGMIYILYAQSYAHALNINANLVLKTLFVTASTNGIAEAAVAVLIVVPVVLGVKKIEHRA